MGEERLLGGPCGVCGRHGKDIDFGDDAWWELDDEEAGRCLLCPECWRKLHAAVPKAEWDRDYRRVIPPYLSHEARPQDDPDEDPFFAALFLWASAAAAQDVTPRQQEILMTAINADGWLTEPMHREFWAAVPRRLLSDPKEVAAMTSAMERGALVRCRAYLRHLVELTLEEAKADPSGHGRPLA